VQRRQQEAAQLRDCRERAQALISDASGQLQSTKASLEKARDKELAAAAAAAAVAAAAPDAKPGCACAAPPARSARLCNDALPKRYGGSE